MYKLSLQYPLTFERIMHNWLQILEPNCTILPIILLPPTPYRPPSPNPLTKFVWCSKWLVHSKNLQYLIVFYSSWYMITCTEPSQPVQGGDSFSVTWLLVPCAGDLALTQKRLLSGWHHAGWLLVNHNQINHSSERVSKRIHIIYRTLVFTKSYILNI